MNKFICSLILLLTLFTQTPLAKPSTCENLRFEKGDFTNWTGKTWLHFYTEILNLSNGIEQGRHTIMSDTSAYDKNTGGKLKLVPPGYKYSARLGDSIGGCRSQSLSYTLTVDSTNALFIWKFAVVLQNPLHDHLYDEQPRFKITLEDQNGNTISSCSQYDVNASEHIPGFQTYTPPGFTRDTDSISLVVWRDWTIAGANLMPFYGKRVTITFTTEDCTKQEHFGYAYFVAECRPMEISVNYCQDDTNARLEAPEGFSSYIWTPGNIEGRTLNVSNATLGDQYTCTFQSTMGCSVALAATIKRTTPSASFRISPLDTDKGQYQFYNTSTTCNGIISNSIWNFGDGTISQENNPIYAFSTGGKHTVSLEVTAAPSGCKNKQSIEITVPNYMPLTIHGDSTFCHGDSTMLTANGRTRYLWSTGAITTTIKMNKEGHIFVIGWNEYGKCDTTYLTIKEKAIPIVSISGVKILCPGETVTLTAKGADTYNWDNSQSSSSINVSTPGRYSVVGTLANGCVSKSVSVNIIEDTIKYGSISPLTKSTTLNLKIPNVFTPNNDGHNDIFMSGYDLQVFDRNGIRLYAGNAGWDGTYKGRRMSPDTYFYLLRYTDDNNIKQIKKGNVMLIR